MAWRPRHSRDTTHAFLYTAMSRIWRARLPPFTAPLLCDAWEMEHNERRKGPKEE
jgi:hypothetical protein